MKVRSIASTLMDTPDQRKGPLAMQAQVGGTHLFLGSHPFMCTLLIDAHRST